MIKAVWNNDKKDFERIPVTPLIILEEHPEGDKKIVSIKKIKPNPLNAELYPDFEITKSAKDLAYGIDHTGTQDQCMKKRMLDGLIVNHEPIKICPITGIIFSGHTRYYAALMIGAKYVYVVYADEIYSEDIPETIMTKILQHYNYYKRSEFSFKQQVFKTKNEIRLIEKEHNLTPGVFILVGNSHYFNKFYKERMTFLQNVFLNKKEKNLRYIKNIIKIIQSGECDRIVKEIDEGKLALSNAVKELNQSKKKPYIVNPNRFNFLKHFDKNNLSIISKMKNYFFQARFNYFNNNVVKTDDLGEINIITNKVVGNENPKKTSVLSDIMMSTLAIVYRELGFDTVTAGTATNSADIQFLDLTKIARQKNCDYPAEEIEVKAAVSKGDNATFYGGPDMKKHIKDYLIGVYNKDHTEVCMFITTINGPLVVKSGTKNGTTMDLKTILKYHKKYMRFIYGSIDNKNELVFEKI